MGEQWKETERNKLKKDPSEDIPNQNQKRIIGTLEKYEELLKDQSDDAPRYKRELDEAMETFYEKQETVRHDALVEIQTTVNAMMQRTKASAETQTDEELIEAYIHEKESEL